MFGVFMPCSFRLLCSFNNLENLLVNSTNSLSGVEAFETLKAGRRREHEHPAACLYPAFTPCCDLSVLKRIVTLCRQGTVARCS